jgi:hypothetical protein
MPGLHGSAERRTSDDKRDACGGFPRNGDKDYGSPEPFCLGRQLEEEPQQPPAVTREVGLRPREEKERFP